MAKISTLSPGDIFQLNETVGGVTKAVDFVVLAHNHHAQGRTTVIRKDILSNMAFDTRILPSNDIQTTPSLFIPYSQSQMDAWLRNTYKQYLSATLQAKITNVNISSHETYSSGTSLGAPTTISRDIFLLSVYELGINTINNPSGTVIPYFASDASRLAYFNSVVSNYWTRHLAMRVRAQTVLYMNESGTQLIAQDGSLLYGVRPAFTLPSDFELIQLPIYVKQSGVWVQAEKLTVKDGGVHKDIKGIYYKQSGVWLEV